MDDVCIRFSRLRGQDDSILTKQYRLDENGDICKVSQPRISPTEQLKRFVSKSFQILKALLKILAPTRALLREFSTVRL